MMKEKVKQNDTNDQQEAKQWLTILTTYL
jgi:hypothetical protein